MARLSIIAGSLILLAVGLLTTLTLAPPATYAQAPKPTRAPMSIASQPDAKIIAGNPLTIHVGSNASVQVYYAEYGSGQVYGDADSGIFLWVNGDVYGSNLPKTDLSSGANDTLDLDTIAHTVPTGSGTASDPWVVTTVAHVGTSGLQVTQTVSYVNGRKYFDLDWTIKNNSSSPITFDFFHAADLYFPDGGDGYGYYHAGSGSVGGYDQDWYISFVPQTPATFYQEAYYATIWDAIGSCQTPGSCTKGVGFTSTITDTSIDNGIGLQWHITELDPGATVSLSDWWNFGTTFALPSTTLCYLPLIINFTPPPPEGFNAQFNGSAPGWETHSGSWTVDSNYYSTAGSPNVFSSVSYAKDFANLDYQVRLQRTGCGTCNNRLMIRGTPPPLGLYDDWYSFYSFEYNRNGNYSVWKKVAGGALTPLRSWTASSAIQQGDAWNTLRVVANGNNLSFYINGTRVWSGSDSSLASGRVGISMFRDSSSGNQLLVDWATLTALGTGALAMPAR